MEKKIVIGSLFGDEGKGATTQWLCCNAIAQGKRPLVVRYTGGPQAGHTVETVKGGNVLRHVFSTFGSGTLLNVPTLYADTALVDPICLVNELDVLLRKGVNPVFDVSDAMVITPYDVFANRNSAQNLSHGTCGKGIYMAWLRSQQSRFTIFDDAEKILEASASYHGLSRDINLDKLFIDNLLKVRKLNCVISIKDFDTVIYESSQGLLLDADLGFLPHVTATSTGLQYLGSFEDFEAEVFLASRSYLTRHGNGYRPISIDGYNLNDPGETNVLNEFQGEFKTGVFDFNLVNQAISRHQLSRYSKCRFNLALSHLDTLVRNQRFLYLEDGELYEIPVADEADYSHVAELFMSRINLKLQKAFGCDSPLGSYVKF